MVELLVLEFVVIVWKKGIWLSIDIYSIATLIPSEGFAEFVEAYGEEERRYCQNEAAECDEARAALLAYGAGLETEIVRLRNEVALA